MSGGGLKAVDPVPALRLPPAQPHPGALRGVQRVQPGQPGQPRSELPTLIRHKVGVRCENRQRGGGHGIIYRNEENFVLIYFKIFKYEDLYSHKNLLHIKYLNFSAF